MYCSRTSVAVMIIVISCPRKELEEARDRWGKESMWSYAYHSFRAQKRFHSVGTSATPVKGTSGSGS